MVRSPSREEISGVKKGPWSPEEDRKLVEHVQKHGCGSWKRMPKLAGLNRCGKSCRLRWTNYLRPDIKRGKFTEEEEQLIVHIHSLVGNKWSLMATKLPGRTDNEIKNYWNTHLRKKLLRMGIDPVTHRPTMNNLNLLTRLSNFLSAANFGNMTTHLENALKLQADAAHLVKLQLLQSLIQALEGSSSSTPNMDLMRLFGSSSLGNNLQASDLLQLSRQIEACGGGSFNLQDSTPVTPTLSNLGQYSNNIDLQPAPESNFSMDEGEAAAASDAWRMEEHGVEISDVPSTSSFPASNSTPFVSASPETKNIDLIESSDKIYSNPLAFTSFEAWENLNLDNLITDLGWKEDQIPWPNAPYSSGSAIDQIHIERS